MRVVVLSDVHPGSAGTATDDAFISFVEWLTERAQRLLWFNAGAWVNAGYGFLEVNERPDAVVARLYRWDPDARSALAATGPLRSRSGIAQDRAPTTRARNAGSMSSVDPVASP